MLKRHYCNTQSLQSMFMFVCNIGPWCRHKTVWTALVTLLCVNFLLCQCAREGYFQSFMMSLGWASRHALGQGWQGQAYAKSHRNSVITQGDSNSLHVYNLTDKSECTKHDTRQTCHAPDNGGGSAWWQGTATATRPLHLESSKQNCYIISLWAIIKAISFSAIARTQSWNRCKHSGTWRALVATWAVMLRVLLFPYRTLMRHGEMLLVREAEYVVAFCAGACVQSVLEWRSLSCVVHWFAILRWMKPVGLTGWHCHASSVIWKKLAPFQLTHHTLYLAQGGPEH